MRRNEGRTVGLYNVNQIARRCNETHNLYAQDVEDLRRGYAQVWKGVNELLKKFEKL